MPFDLYSSTVAAMSSRVAPTQEIWGAARWPRPWSSRTASGFRSGEQGEGRSVSRVVRTGGIAGRGADAAVFLCDQLGARKSLARGVAPVLLSHALVQELRKGFGEPVGESLEHDRAVIVVIRLEGLDPGIDPDSRGDCEGADVIGNSRVPGRDEVGEAQVRAIGGLFALLAQAVPHHRRFTARLVRVDLDILADARRRIQAERRVRLQGLPADDFLQHRPRLRENAARP